MNTTEELKNEICRRVSSTGAAEFQLAYDRATAADPKLNGQALIGAIAKELEAWRGHFMANGVFSAASTMLPAAEWQRIYAESEKKARELLLESSGELVTLKKLEKEATEAQRRARQQADKLEKLYNEWAGLPGSASLLRAKLNAVASERENLAEPLQTQFRSAYREYIAGSHNDKIGLDVISTRILSRGLRFAILDNIEAETSAELQKLEKRNAELSKILGRPRHQI